jgi:hypothetical protein
VPPLRGKGDLRYKQDLSRRHRPERGPTASGPAIIQPFSGCAGAVSHPGALCPVVP